MTRYKTFLYGKPVGIIEHIESEHGRGPRGDYYVWCSLLENGTLEFGEEQGNYAGGTTLSEEFHPYNDNYIDAVKRELKFYENKPKDFRKSIIKAMERHKDLFGKMIEALNEPPAE